MLGFATLALSAFLVVLLNPSIAGVGSYALGSSLEPALDGIRAMLRRLGGGAPFGIVALIGLVASFHTILYAQGRQVYSLSRAGYFPSGLSETHARYKTPHIAMIAGSLLGLGVMLVIWFVNGGGGPGETQLGDDIIGSVLLNMAVFGAMLSYIAQALSFIILRRKLPNIERPFQQPGRHSRRGGDHRHRAGDAVLPAAGPELLQGRDLGDRLVRGRYRLFRAGRAPQAHPVARGRVRARARQEGLTLQPIGSRGHPRLPQNKQHRCRSSVMASPAYSLDQLKADVKAGTIDTVLVAFPDMQGRLIGKRFQAEFFLEGAIDETHGCNYLLADDIDMEPVPGYDAASWEKGYGDFVMKPDPATLMKCTWLEGTALILADLVDHHHHEPIPHSPRAVLKRQLKRLEALRAYRRISPRSWSSTCSTRTSAPSTRRDTGTSRRRATTSRTTTSSRPPRKRGDARVAASNCTASGIPVENSKGEWGPGQEEINVRYAEALTMADRHVVIKNATKEIAYLQGKAVTFMSKWDFGLAGSSSHIHMSLAKGGKNQFVDAADPLGMSELMKQFLAGQLTYAGDITYFLAPYINSYKRFQAGTFAPTKAVWSIDNRTSGFRLCGENTKGIRVECRIGGADLNPYLAFAALIAAGLKGIEDKLVLEPVFEGDAYAGTKLREVHKTLRDATVALRNSKMLIEALGQDVIDHYVHTAEWEQFEYDRRVTDWELKRGFERS